MAWIHEQPGWPNFVWDNNRLAMQLATVRHLQGKLLGQMQHIGFTFQQEASLQTLVSEVMASAAIEGEQLPLDQVRSSVAKRLGIDIGGVVRAARDVEGFVDIMLDATQQPGLPLTADRLCGWHAALFPSGYSGLHKIIVGTWRKEPMQVVSGPLGKETIHYEAPLPDKLRQEMDVFLQWFNSDQAVDPVLKAGIAHFWFITIHPFDDGNGRIARTITDLSLARADGCLQRYYSLSSQIEIERNAYYEILELQQRSTTLDITPWLVWFLDCLGRAIEKADQEFDRILYCIRLWQFVSEVGVNDRQRKILTKMLGEFEGYLNTSKYAKMAKCSTDTALRDIQDLLAKKILKQNPGKGRSTSYWLVDF